MGGGGGGGGMLLLLNPRKLMSLRWPTEEAAVTLHFEMVVSADKVADLQRVGMLSSLGEFSITYRKTPSQPSK